MMKDDVDSHGNDDESTQKKKKKKTKKKKKKKKKDKTKKKKNENVNIMDSNGCEWSVDFNEYDDGGQKTKDQVQDNDIMEMNWNRNINDSQKRTALFWNN